MSEYTKQMFLERIEGGNCCRLEPLRGGESVAGLGIGSVIVETFESTPNTAFWGTPASCNRFNVVIQRLG